MTMKSAGDMEEVIKIIRSLLLSAPHGLTVNELCSEYTAITYKSLPYKELGYNSAIDMVKDMPHVIRPIFYGSALILKGIADESTAHINELVRHQRSSSRRNTRIKTIEVKTPIKKIIPSFIQKRISEIMADHPKGIMLSSLCSSYTKRYGSKLDPKRLGFPLVSDIFKNCPDIVKLKRMAVDNELIVLPVEGLISPPPQKSSQEALSRPSKMIDLFENTCSVPVKIQDEIAAVLSKKPNGIWSARFPFEYKEYHNKELNYQSLGFDSIVELMSKVKQHVSIERPVSNGDWILKPIQAGVPLIPGVTVPNPLSEVPSMAVTNEHSKYSLQSPGELNELIEIYLSYIIDPTLFWFQCVSSMNQLNNLMHEMGDFYSIEDSSKLYQLTKTYIRKKQVCSALYEDGDWYRAIITNISSEKEIQVFYVDYGNIATVDILSLRFLKPIFLNLPAQAFRGKLYNVKPLLQKWPRHSVSRFFELTNDRQLFATLKSFYNLPETECPLRDGIVTSMSLINTYGKDDVDITEVLVNENRASSDVIDTKESEMNSLHSFYEEYYQTLQKVSLLHQTSEASSSASNASSYTSSADYSLSQRDKVYKVSEINNNGQNILHEKDKRIDSRLHEKNSHSNYKKESRHEECVRNVSRDHHYHSVDKSVILQYQVHNNTTKSYDDDNESTVEHKVVRVSINKNIKNENEKLRCDENTNENCDVVKRVVFNDTTSLHFIYHNNGAYIASGDISSLFWLGDILRQMLRRLDLSIPYVVLCREENQELFKSLANYDIKGLKKVVPIAPALTVYDFHSLMKLLPHFKLKSEQMKEILEIEFRVYNSLSTPRDYFHNGQPDTNNTDELETLRLHCQALTFKKKRLYMSMMLNRAPNNTIDQVRTLDERIQSIEKNIKSLVQS